MGQIKRMTPQTAASVVTALLKQRGAANALPEAHRDAAYGQLHGHLLAIFQGLGADHTFMSSDVAQSRLYQNLLKNAQAQAQGQPPEQAPAPAPVAPGALDPNAAGAPATIVPAQPQIQTSRPIDGPTPLPPTATGRHGVIANPARQVPVQAPTMPLPQQPHQVQPQPAPQNNGQTEAPTPPGPPAF